MKTPEERKAAPVFSGVLRYFPDAVLAVAALSKVGNDQHNPGEPMHWARDKSTDHGDCIARHLLDAGSFDTDGQRHSAKVAWRALALLQTELEQAAAEAEQDAEETAALAPLVWADEEDDDPQPVEIAGYVRRNEAIDAVSAILGGDALSMALADVAAGGDP